MPMVLAPMVSSQSWIAILQEKMARLLAPPTDDAAQNLVSIEEMLNNGQSRNCSDATASPTLTPAPAPIAAQPTEVKLLENYALGPLRVYVGGRQLTAADWGYRHAQAVAQAITRFF